MSETALYSPPITLRRRPCARQYSALDSTEKLLFDIFASRGEVLPERQDYPLSALEKPAQLKGLDAAVSLLVAAMRDNKNILVVGDFDADGATSSALALRCLRAFGHARVDFLVPNRFVFGYGLTPEIVAAAAAWSPDLIVTVDNGISSHAGVAAARACGMQVLVTDHHLPGLTTPDADAIVNPNQPGCAFSSKNLAGVGVVFYVMSALRSALREMDWFTQQGIAEPNMASFLDLVALGTVADVVPLDYNNRTLVAAGLARMRAGQCCAGIRALMQIAGREPRRLHASDLGFALAPRLNAAGRLDDMSLGIQCLLADDESAALALARELDDLNRDRKSIEGAMQLEAEKLLKDIDRQTLRDHAGLCLYKADWHQGVIGILASRIKDKLHRPTIVFANDEGGGLKGSGRSIPGVHLRDVLDEIAATHPALLTRFGGHAMAAGLSLAPEHLEEFSRVFDRVVARHLDEEMASPVLLSDGALPDALMTLPVAEALRRAGPWGQQFPEPLFDGVFSIVQQRIVGGRHLKLVLAAGEHSHQVFDAVCFNVDIAKWPNPVARRLRVAYHLDINEYRGNVQVQLLLRHIEVLADSD